MPTEGTPRRSIRIDDALWNQAKQLAEQQGRTLTDIIRQQLKQWIHAQGDNT